eukprot:scaffold155_cov347-Pavlova_lutheri.AAC.76
MALCKPPLRLGSVRRSTTRFHASRGRDVTGQGTQVGRVYLVGTGPGDPGLLTLRAWKLMQTADVVLYDRLVSPEILQMVHQGAKMVYVGKEKSFHTRKQEEIHQLMQFFAEEGASVLRLKGGDPYVFGRGGEEMEYLEERGVKVYCVPGITAAAGIGAELGIPMTHRGLATSVRFLTGHLRTDGSVPVDNLHHVNGEETTLVVYMGLSTLPELVEKLGEGGMEGTTPAVAVERGTLPEQRAVFANLSKLCEKVGAAQLESPTLIVIGEVVSLAPGWKRREEGVWEGLAEDKPTGVAEYLTSQWSGDAAGSREKVRRR